MECVEHQQRQSFQEGELDFEVYKELRTMAVGQDSGCRKQKEPKSKGKEV